jgi:hypothetical protein
MGDRGVSRVSRKENIEEAENEDRILNELRPRLDNWYEVYRDRKRYSTSITEAACLALKRKLYDPEKDKEPKYPEERWLRTKNERDADMLEFVWSSLSEPSLEGVQISPYGPSARDAQEIIFSYVFGGRESRFLIRRRQSMKSATFDRAERRSLLFFARLLAKTEKEFRN